MEIIESLEWRYATKVFDSQKKLTEDQLNKLKEALILTPSSFGLQPWKFLFIKNQEIKNKLLEHTWNQKQVVDASHIIVLCRLKNLDKNYVDSFLKDTAKKRNQNLSSLDGLKKMLNGFLFNDKFNYKEWADNQVNIALGNLMTVASLLKIDACPIGGFIPEKYDEVLNLKEQNLASVLVCPVGFRKEEEDKYAHLKKIRFSKKELIINL